MNVEDIQHIRAIASITRTELLPLTTDAGLYPRLAGACAICSTVLCRVLISQGYPALLVCGRFGDQEDDEYHAFVIVGNWIVDITATQFGNYPEVYMVPSNNNKYEKILFGAEAEQDFCTWYEPQRPSEYKKELNRIVKTINNKLVEYQKVG